MNAARWIIRLELPFEQVLISIRMSKLENVY